MSDAIKKLHDYLAMSPSVVYPEDVLAYLPAIEAENANLRELATYALKHIIEAECEDPDRDRKRFWGKPCEDCSDCGSSDCPKCMPRMFGVSGIEVD